MGYRRLAPKDRYQLEVYLQSGFGVREISKRLKVAPSTISRELKRLSGEYNADHAQADAKKVRATRYQTRKKIKGVLKLKVERRLAKLWSPEQIAADLGMISHQTIYRFIKNDKPQLKAHLRVLRKQRRDRTKPSFGTNREFVRERKFIDQRPKVVELRMRLGDFERDTVLGKLNSTSLLTIVDRRSRLLKLALIEKKSSELIHRATVHLLKNEVVHTITNDNSTEFARHKETAKELKTQIYFSKAYRSWERGTNENTNGLLRQYFPRKTEIGYPTKQELKRIAHQLNTRPRKCLGWKTPLQVHKELSGQVLR